MPGNAEIALYVFSFFSERLLLSTVSVKDYFPTIVQP